MGSVLDILKYNLYDFLYLVALLKHDFGALVNEDEVCIYYLSHL